MRPDEPLIDSEEALDSIYIVIHGQISVKTRAVDLKFDKDQILLPELLRTQMLDYTTPLRYDTEYAGVPVKAASWPVLKTSVIRIYMNELENIHEGITARIKSEQTKLISNIKWFATFSGENTESFRSELVIRHCKKGEIIYEVGEESTHFFLLFAGEVRTDSCFNVEHITKWPHGLHDSEWHFQ